MKKIIIFLVITLFVSCKKEANISSQNNIKNNEKGFVSYGDTLISQSVYITQLQNSIDIKQQRINLSKLKFDYDKFLSWNYNTIEEKKFGNITLKFQKENKTKQGADIFTNIKLTIVKDNKSIDDLIVYKQENYGEALVAINQYFYIDSNLNLWTLEVNEDEDGIKVKSWISYLIDKKSGKINLIKKNETNSNNVINTNESSDIWIGKYFLEKSNKDELKTSFEITINNLEDIKVTYISDGDEAEIYENLKAEVVDEDKIKIIFNKKYNKMGIIYIQNHEKEYFISGEPISNINPGNDEYFLNKE